MCIWFLQGRHFRSSHTVVVDLNWHKHCIYLSNWGLVCIVWALCWCFNLQTFSQTVNKSCKAYRAISQLQKNYLLKAHCCASPTHKYNWIHTDTDEKGCFHKIVLDSHRVKLLPLKWGLERLFLFHATFHANCITSPMRTEYFFIAFPSLFSSLLTFPSRLFFL